MARGEGNRVVAVARYSPHGNQPGAFLSNVRPPIRGLPPGGQISRTREEANMSVQTALLPPSPNASSSPNDIIKKKPVNQKLNQNGLTTHSPLLTTDETAAILDDTFETSAGDDQLSTSSNYYNTDKSVNSHRSKGSSLSFPTCCGVTLTRKRSTGPAPGTPRPSRHFSGRRGSHGGYRSTGSTTRVTVGSSNENPELKYLNVTGEQDSGDLVSGIPCRQDPSGDTLTSVHQSRTSKYLPSASDAQCYSRSASVQSQKTETICQPNLRSSSLATSVRQSSNVSYNCSQPPATISSYEAGRPLPKTPYYSNRPMTNSAPYRSNKQYPDGFCQISRPIIENSNPPSRPITATTYHSVRPITSSSYLSEPVT